MPLGRQVGGDGGVGDGDVDVVVEIAGWEGWGIGIFFGGGGSGFFVGGWLVWASGLEQRVGFFLLGPRRFSLVF